MCLAEVCLRVFDLAFLLGNHLMWKLDLRNKSKL